MKANKSFFYSSLFSKQFNFITLTLICLILWFLSGCGGDSSVTDYTGISVATPTTSPAITGDSSSIVDTGQTKCYDLSTEITPPDEGETFYGQDGQFEGIQLSYVENGDGTITDLNTGLMWQQTPDESTFSWQEAMDYCESLQLAGYDDWRAPNLKELFSISDFSSGWPYINTDYFNLTGDTSSKAQQYWSSNYYYVGTTHNGANSAFGVNHNTGHIKAYPSDAGGPMGKYVRAVRIDTGYGENNFVDNGDGTISDLKNGLMWIQDDYDDPLDWANALSYANSLTYAGYSDWRLPNVKELQSIVDYSGVFPAIDSRFQCTQITNEAGDSDYGYYWTGTSAYFGTNSPEYYYAWYVAFGYAVNDAGDDTHGAGAVRFDTKVEGGPLGEGGERYYNYVRCVRDI